MGYAVFFTHSDFSFPGYVCEILKELSNGCCLTKLFQIEHNRLIKIGDPKILESVRFNSVEIGRERAFILAQNFTNFFLD